MSAAAHILRGRAAQPPDTTPLTALCRRFTAQCLPSTSPPIDLPALLLLTILKRSPQGGMGAPVCVSCLPCGQAAHPPDVTPSAALCLRFAPLCLPSTSTPARCWSDRFLHSIDVRTGRQARTGGPGERRSCTASRYHPGNRPVPAIYSPMPPVDLPAHRPPCSSPPHNTETLPPGWDGRPSVRVMFTVRASCTPSRCHPISRPVPAIRSPLPPIDLTPLPTAGPIVSCIPLM